MSQLYQIFLLFKKWAIDTMRLPIDLIEEDNCKQVSSTKFIERYCELQT